MWPTTAMNEPPDVAVPAVAVTAVAAHRLQRVLQRLGLHWVLRLKAPSEAALDAAAMLVTVARGVEQHPHLPGEVPLAGIPRQQRWHCGRFDSRVTTEAAIVVLTSATQQTE
jgi:hypothetical protein